MIRIALSYSKFATSKSGGARESLLTLLEGAARTTDITVDAYQTPPADDPPDENFEYRIHTESLYSVPKLTWTDQVISRIQWGRYLRRQLTTRYDFLLTQNQLAPVSVLVANELRIPSLFFVRSMALTGYEKYDPSLGHLSNLLKTDLGGRVQYPFLWKNFHDYGRAALNATYTIANSEFTAAKLDNLFGVNARVIYPPIELENYRVEYGGDGYITMVNPRAEYKGPDIFLDIADEFPNEKFLLVGPISSKSIGERAAKSANVDHWTWCEDMRDAYSSSKLVVVPSRVEESFGRVPAEAMVSGIPCVVSNRGALPDVVGDTGIVIEEVESVDHWVSGIQRAIDDHDPEAQKQRAQKFSAEKQVEKFVNLIDNLEL